jgi:peptidyl-prolyl cis-trans isomerase A (cyclophilin A)
MIRLVVALAALLSTLAPSPATAAAGPARVRIETSAGAIVIALETKRAPVTSRNFLAYVDEKRFDGTSFYRAARSRTKPGTGFVQGGINHVATRMRNPIPHEPTSRTGLRHVSGTISMARNAPGTAMGDFFIAVGPAPYLDARPGFDGYAAFGKVVAGMEVVKKILGAPTYPGGRSQATMGQSIVKPVRILSARRVR